MRELKRVGTIYEFLLTTEELNAIIERDEKAECEDMLSTKLLRRTAVMDAQYGGFVGEVVRVELDYYEEGAYERVRIAEIIEDYLEGD